MSMTTNWVPQAISALLGVKHAEESHQQKTCKKVINDQSQQCSTKTRACTREEKGSFGYKAAVRSELFHYSSQYSHVEECAWWIQP